MTIRNTVNEWLSAIGQELGTELALDDSGGCGLAFKGDIEIGISLDEENQLVHLCAPMRPLPETLVDLHAHLMEAMQLNNELTEGRSGCLALSPREDELMYCLACPLQEYDLERFAVTLAAFLGNCGKLKEALSDPMPSIYAPLTSSPEEDFEESEPDLAELSDL